MGQSKRKKNHRPPGHKQKKHPAPSGSQDVQADRQAKELSEQQKEFAREIEQQQPQSEQQPSPKEEKRPSEGQRRRKPRQQREPQQRPAGAVPDYVYLVKNPKSSETYFCGSDQKLEKGTMVIAPTRYGLDMAQVLGYVRSMMLSATVRELDEQESEVRYIDVEVPCLDCEGCGCHDEKQEEPAEPVDEQQQQIENERQQLFAEALEQERETRAGELRNLDWIDRIADEYDIAQYEENAKKAEQAYGICKEKIAQHKLDMKLVDAHYMLSESKVLFFFTADNRVDFRALVKDLVSVFRMRIELRQIGVRDESRILGGMAVCGRDYCCHGVTDRLNPVSIKMAKEQNLSLNSMKISGPCGRLLCCLSYEYDFYKEEKRKLPNTGSRLKIRDELLKISEVNILSRKYHLTASDGRLLIIPFDKVVFNKDTGRWDVDTQYIEEVLSV